MGASGKIQPACQVDNRWASEDDDTLGCGCVACLKQLPPDGNPIPHDRRLMVVCSICGNKRCPHAEDHRYVCTGSNATGQVGLILPDDDGCCHLDIDLEPIDPDAWGKRPDAIPRLCDARRLSTDLERRAANARQASR